MKYFLKVNSDKVFFNEPSKASQVFYNLCLHTSTIQVFFQQNYLSSLNTNSHKDSRIGILKIAQEVH